MAFVPYAFTSAQLADIRRFCGYPAYGSGSVVFPEPWIMKQYLALEFKIENLSQDEGTVVVNTYLTNLYTLENAIPAASANLDTDSAGPWKHNAHEQRDRERMFDSWRRRLCDFLGIPPGPFLRSGGLTLVV